MVTKINNKWHDFTKPNPFFTHAIQTVRYVTQNLCVTWPNYRPFVLDWRGTATQNLHSQKLQMFAFRKRLFAYVEASYFTENWYRKVKFENAYSCDVRYVTQSKNYFKYEDMVRSLKTKVFLIEKRLNFFICQLILLGSAYCRHCFISKLKKCLQTVRYVTENGPCVW